jgi:hypothetical protein
MLTRFGEIPQNPSASHQNGDHIGSTSTLPVVRLDNSSSFWPQHQSGTLIMVDGPVQMGKRYFTSTFQCSRNIVHPPFDLTSPSAETRVFLPKLLNAIKPGERHVTCYSPLTKLIRSTIQDIINLRETEDVTYNIKRQIKRTKYSQESEADIIKQHQKFKINKNTQEGQLLANFMNQATTILLQMEMISKNFVIYFLLPPKITKYEDGLLSFPRPDSSQGGIIFHADYLYLYRFLILLVKEISPTQIYYLMPGEMALTDWGLWDFTSMSPPHHITNYRPKSKILPSTSIRILVLESDATLPITSIIRNMPIKTMNITLCEYHIRRYLFCIEKTMTWFLGLTAPARQTVFTEYTSWWTTNFFNVIMEQKSLIHQKQKKLAVIVMLHTPLSVFFGLPRYTLAYPTSLPPHMSQFLNVLERLENTKELVNKCQVHVLLTLANGRRPKVEKHADGNWIQGLHLQLVGDYCRRTKHITSSSNLFVYPEGLDTSFHREFKKIVNNLLLKTVEIDNETIF